MYGITLLGILAIMGGAIAYIGDKLGTRVGKRKLTIFGLRPKHTSILVTIITGILIAASTLGILASVSSDVRTALFGMEALKAQLAGLAQEVDVKNKELEASRQALEQKTKEYAALTAKIQDTTAKLTQVSQELDAVMRERDRTAAALSETQRSFAAARSELNKARTEIDSLLTTKAELDARVAVLNESKGKLEKDVEELNQYAAALTKSLRDIRQGSVIFQAGQVLTQSIMSGGKTKTECEEGIRKLLGETNHSILERFGVEDKGQQVLLISPDNVDKTVERMTATSEELVIRITAYGNVVYGEPIPVWIDLIPNRLIYNAGDVVFTEVVDVGTTTRQAETAVWTFLQRVNEQAAIRGILKDPLNGTVGAMGGVQLYEAVNAASRHGGRVELTAVTPKAAYTSGPLEIEIRVRGL